MVLNSDFRNLRDSVLHLQASPRCRSAASPTKQGNYVPTRRIRVHDNRRRETTGKPGKQGRASASLRCAGACRTLRQRREMQPGRLRIIASSQAEQCTNEWKRSTDQQIQMEKETSSTCRIGVKARTFCSCHGSTRIHRPVQELESECFPLTAADMEYQNLGNNRAVLLHELIPRISRVP
jgi:hypothetical protein